MTSYRPMTLADLGRRLTRVDDAKNRWKLVWEFLEEYRWEPDHVQPSLLRDKPPATGDERWDTLLAALAKHLAAQRDLAAPEWTEIRVLQRPWFPAELAASRRAGLGTGGIPQARRLPLSQGPGGRVTWPDDVLFGRAQIERAFTALGERLVRRGVVADVFVVGGAAMALAHDGARVTRDVDAVFKPHGIVLEEARNVADDRTPPLVA